MQVVLVRLSRTGNDFGVLEGDVAQKDEDFIRTDLVVTIKIEPKNKKRKFSKLFLILNGFLQLSIDREVNTYILKVRRIFVSTLDEKTWRRSSMKLSS